MDVPVRARSECLLGDVFGSRARERRELLGRAAATTGAHGRGVVIYLRVPSGVAHSAAEIGHAPHDPVVIAGILRELGVRSIRSASVDPVPGEAWQEPKSTTQPTVPATA